MHTSTVRKPLILIAGETLGLGGAEKVTVDLANALHESNDYRVHVVATLTKDGLFADRLAEGIDVSLAPTPQALTALVALKKPDGIVLNNCRMAKQCIDEMLARHTPRYLGFFLHGASKWSMDLLPEALSDGSEVVTISREAKAEILRQRPDIERSAVGVITNCVDTKRFRPLEDGELLPEKVWDEPHGPVFGYAGRFSGEKSLVTMVDVFRRARQRIPDARLLMVGGADPGVPVYETYWTAEQRVVEQAVRQMGLVDAVHITGAVTNPEAFYRQMDVFLLTSQFEGVPLVLLEAMASGVPVVATAVGAIPRILKQGAGYAVARQGLDLDESEREFFADRMVEVATSPKRRHMGAAARSKAKRLYSLATYRRTVLTYFDKRFSQ